MSDLMTAARAFVAADEAVRDAINGGGHPGEHDRLLHFEPCNFLSGVAHVYDLSGDCSACGGAQYGTEADRNLAMGDLREALGMERRPWEVR
jgi:hypothetical protein